MPAKYHIHTHPAPPKNKVIGKYGIIDWREDCSACHNCVKRECAYSVYNDEQDRLRNTVEYVDYLYECRGCLCCVQSCTKGLLTWDINPEYLAMGDEVWTADIISSTWYQAETGKVPVSGAGYPGPFRGPGFDSILTDMSEIVRPTRDGIHGREYISTQVDIGRKPMSLKLNADGSLSTSCPPIVEAPLPVVFNIMPWHNPGPGISRAILNAAQKLGTLVITDDPDMAIRPSTIPSISASKALKLTGNEQLVEWADCPNIVEKIREAKRANPQLIAIARLPLGSTAVTRVIELAKQNADSFHLLADWRGVVRESGEEKHITDAIRDVHLALIREGIRDEVTIIAGGGISMAEHVVKMLICGADLVSIDVPLMIALECRVCMNCQEGLLCPVNLPELDQEYATQRIVNLMGAWHSQMLEMMGAMGIREARRLRGEVGRAMFFDDLERECFGPIFGTRKSEVK